MSLEKVLIANYSMTCNFAIFTKKNKTCGLETAYVFRFKDTATDLSIPLIKISLFILKLSSIIVLPCHSTQAVSHQVCISTNFYLKV